MREKRPQVFGEEKTFSGWQDDFDYQRERRRDLHHDDEADREQIEEARAEKERYVDAPGQLTLLPRRGAA